MNASTQGVDVLIMGAGIAGMVTALRAAQMNLQVIVFEQGIASQYPCNTRLTSGIFHCALQSAATPASTLLERIQHTTQGHADNGLAELMANEALHAVRWLQTQGIRFIKGAQHYHEYILSPPTLFHQNEGWRNKGGDALLKQLEQALTAAQGRLMRGHRVVKLLEQQGRCTGVVTQQPSGQCLSFQAKHVVIADGGYQGNPQWLKQGVSAKPQELFQRNAKQSHGDGMAMAKSLGAAIDVQQGFYGHLLSKDAFVNDHLWPNPWMDPLASAGMLVMKNGKRFADEGLGGIHLANELAKSNTPLEGFIISDQNIWQTRGRQNLVCPNPKLIEAGAQFFTAANIPDLAHSAGIDPVALEESVRVHNACMMRGDFSDLLPHRTHSASPAAMFIDAPPYYAFPVCAGITYTFGGIKTNAKTQVLNELNHPIPGLWAVGACTAGLEGGPNAGYVGGLIKSTVMALAAAKNIQFDETTKMGTDSA